MRQSWAEGLLPVGLGDGLAEPDPVGVGEGVAEALLLGLAEALLLAEAVLLGVAEALSVALAVAVALLVALAVAVALLVAVAVAVALLVAVPLLVALVVADWLAVAEGDGELLDLAEESETASRTIAVWPAGTERAAEVLAGGWPHTLVAAGFTVAASAAVPPPRRPPTMPEETRAAPATIPNADDPDRADFMAAPSSPWSSSSRPRVSSDSSDRLCAETIPSCRSSTHVPTRTAGEQQGLPASPPEY
ncbi:MAG TPA: hypothetical protein VE464_22490 [Streptosporangiaceae bacterium]|nr:hypothetical protein [Streptosporangiaceae bacterium]